jgi:hypothetical protein
MRSAASRSTLIAWLLVFWPVLQSPPAFGQDAEPPRQPAPDFLFKPPVGSVGVRGAWVLPRAGSDLFDFLNETLTIEKGDFRGGAVEAHVGFAVTSRIDVQFGIEGGRSSVRSEYRDWVDNNFRPIEQTTGLETVHLTGEVRYALLPRGYTVSRLAWVPRGISPYVGLGAGAAFYEFRQTGDFVDYVDNSVFSDDFRSKGWTPTVHAFGGVQWHLYKRLFATVELRYVWADARLERDFVDFEPIDLAGARTSGGIEFVF